MPWYDEYDVMVGGLYVLEARLIFLSVVAVAQ